MREANFESIYEAIPGTLDNRKIIVKGRVVDNAIDELCCGHEKVDEIGLGGCMALLAFPRVYSENVLLLSFDASTFNAATAGALCICSLSPLSCIEPCFGLPFLACIT
jgi:hypothetical protein